MTTSTCTDAFYVNDLDSKQLSAGACPVKGCMSDVKAQLVVYNKKHNLPFCPVHGLRIHEKTFVYYNGGSKEQKELAFKRNIAFNWNFFRAHFLQNTKKVGGIGSVGKIAKMRSRITCSQNWPEHKTPCDNY